MISRVFILAMLLFSSASLYAHSSGEAFVNLAVADNKLNGSLELALIDLEMAIGLDQDQNGNITWGEVVSRKDEIYQYLNAGITVLQADKACKASHDDLLINQKPTGTYAHIKTRFQCDQAIDQLAINYDLMFDRDVRHHALWSITRQENNIAGVFSADNRVSKINFNQSAYSGFVHFLYQGVWHIWIGLDHILFLVLLMFSIERSLLKDEQGRRSRKRLSRTVSLISAFTLAHSLTLVLAVTGWLTPNANWIESLIAVSVVLAGLNFIFEWIKERLWLLVFLFGLIHGFGFASVLQELGLQSKTLMASLLAFNIGVEIGQLAIVLVCVPVIAVIMRYRYYGIRLMQTGAWMVVMLASAWFVQRLAI